MVTCSVHAALPTRTLRHRQIEQENVGLQLPRQFYGFGAVRGFAENLKIGFSLQQSPQAIAKDRVVIGNYEANCWAFLKFMRHFSVARYGDFQARSLSGI